LKGKRVLVRHTCQHLQECYIFLENWCSGWGCLCYVFYSYCLLELLSSKPVIKNQNVWAMYL